MKIYKEKKRKVKSCVHQSKIKANEQNGKKTNQEVIKNIKLFW